MIRELFDEFMELDLYIEIVAVSSYYNVYVRMSGTVSSPSSVLVMVDFPSISPEVCQELLGAFFLNV